MDKLVVGFASADALLLRRIFITGNKYVSGY